MKTIRDTAQMFGRLIDSGYAVMIIAVLAGALIYQSHHSGTEGALHSLPLVKVGTQLPGLDVLDLSGMHVRMEWDSDPRPSIVYLFQPSCVWCNRNLAGEKALAGLKSHRFLALSLTRSGLKEYVDKNQFSFQIYSTKDLKSIQALKPIGTPLTIVVAHGGRVEAVFPGAYTEKSVSALEKTFGIRVPAASTEESVPLSRAESD